MSALTLFQASGGELEFTYKHVLLVDDNLLLASRIRSTLKFLVKTHEFVVTTVATGVEAIRAIMAFDFDLIICDMMMPHMAGDMFYLAVQRIKPQMIPRLLFVSDPDSTEVNAYLKSINAQVVQKPVDAKDLERAITAVLSHKKRAPGGIDIELDHWKDVPCLTDRVATEEDVRAGRAIFYIRPLNNISVRFEDIGLPHCAIFKDENEHQYPVVVVQSELAGDIHYVGFRFLERGNGIGFRTEVELLDKPNELFQSPNSGLAAEEPGAADAMLILPTHCAGEAQGSRLLQPGDVEKTRDRTNKIRRWAALDRYEQAASVWS